MSLSKKGASSSSIILFSPVLRISSYNFHSHWITRDYWIQQGEDDSVNESRSVEHTFENDITSSYIKGKLIIMSYHVSTVI